MGKHNTSIAGDLTTLPAPNPSTPEATRPESTSETWEVGWGIGLTGPNMAALCAYDFQRNRVIPVRCGMRLVAAVPTSEGDKSNLIAAAPDMLSALKAMVNDAAFADLCQGIGHEPEWLKSARLAISKAERGQ